MTFVPQSPHGLHELYEVVDDVLGEEDLCLIEGEQVVAEHIPADRGCGPIYESKPFLSDFFDIDLISSVLVMHQQFLNRKLDFDFPPITIWQYF